MSTQTPPRRAARARSSNLGRSAGLDRSNERR
jgi:hypothetical protein